MDLVAIEEIRQVKHCYLRCVDLKLWDDLADTFTQDATALRVTLPADRPPTADIGITLKLTTT